MAHTLYIQKQAREIVPYLKHTKALLDFGCGDLSLARVIKDERPGISITGIDVVDAGLHYRDIAYRTYDGIRLPFQNTSFDTSIAYHVFHHCDDPHTSLTELMRVTKDTIVMVEPVWRWSIELFFMGFLDRIGNGWRGVAIPMPFAFQKESTWISWAQESGWEVREIKSAGVLPGWLPVGATKLFVFRRSLSRTPRKKQNRKRY